MANRRSKVVKVELTQSYYPFLDGFRGIAIFMILLHHIRRAFNLDYLFVSDPPILKWLFFKSYEVLGVNLTGLYKGIEYVISQLKGILGIEIFFVISGYLISGMLLRREITWNSIMRFYQRRFLRIYPNYALMIFVTLLVYEYTNHEGLLAFIKSMLIHFVFFQNYAPVNPYLTHTWTMVVLEQFYMLCPLIILMVNCLVKIPEIRRKVLIAISVGAMLMALSIRVYFLQTGRSFLTGPLISEFPYQTITFHMGPIGLGCLLALLEPYWSKWPKNKFLGGILWLIGIYVFFQLYFRLDWSYYWGEWYLYLLGYWSFCLLFFAAYHGVSIFSNLGFFKWLGRHSYGIYIWHNLILIFWKPWFGSIPPTLIIIFSFVTSVAAGVISSITIEKYFLALRKKLVPTI